MIHCALCNDHTRLLEPLNPPGLSIEWIEDKSAFETWVTKAETPAIVIVADTFQEFSQWYQEVSAYLSDHQHPVIFASPNPIELSNTLSLPHVHDVIELPTTSTMFEFRVRHALRFCEAIRTANDASTQLSHFHQHDPVSGALTPAAFHASYQVEVTRSWRYTLPVSLAIIEISWTARQPENAPNDSNIELPEELHQVAMKRVGELLQHSLRETDLIGRLDHHQFGACLAHTHYLPAIHTLERSSEAIVHAMQNELFAPYTITVSIGISELNQNDSKTTDLYNRSLKALEEARKSGYSIIRAEI